MASPVLELPEEETRALSTNIQAQLSQLPTVISSPDDYRKAKESLPVLKRAEDRVVLFFKDIKAAAYEAHRKLSAKENDALSPIKQARQRISSLIYGYEQEQARVKREAERKAAEEEKRRREEDAIREAETMSALSPEIAEQILEQEIAAPAPVVVLPSTNVEVSGVSVRENWQYVYSGGSPGQKWKDLTDEQRKRVISLIPREFLMPDESAIGRVVKAMKSGTKIPGVQAYDAGTVAVRG
jgi:hypothetical protein